MPCPSTVPPWCLGITPVFVPKPRGPLVNGNGLSLDRSRPITRICAVYQTGASENFPIVSVDYVAFSRPYFLTESSTESYLDIVGGRRQKTGVRIVPNDLGCSTRSTQPPRRRAHPKQAALRSGPWERDRLLASVRVVARRLQILPSPAQREATAMRQCNPLNIPLALSIGPRAEHWLRVNDVWLRTSEDGAL